MDFFFSYCNVYVYKHFERRTNTVINQVDKHYSLPATLTLHRSSREYHNLAWWFKRLGSRCPQLESTSSSDTVQCGCLQRAEPAMTSYEYGAFSPPAPGAVPWDGRRIVLTLFPSALFPHHARSHTISVVLQITLHGAAQKAH